MRRVRSTEIGNVVEHTDGRFVCENCIGDEGVRNFIKNFDPQNHMDEKSMCSYCHIAEGPHLDWVAEHIYEGPFSIFHAAEDILSYDYESGEYRGLSQDTPGALWDCNLDIKSAPLFMDIADALPDKEWARRDEDGDFIEDFDEYQKRQKRENKRERQRRLGEWRQFCRYVKYKRRYFFLHQSVENFVPRTMLDSLGDFVEYTAKEIKCGEMPIYRARVGFFREAKEIREPVPQKALASNRMSPAGIPMFYGCYELDGALRETYDETQAKDGDIVTVGQFKFIKPVLVLDLNNIPELPSGLSEGLRGIHENLVCHEREPGLFLKEFSKQIAKPVIKDGREHIDYVPTQIFTEYLRTKPLPTGKEAGGIVYPSALRHSRHAPKSQKWACIALFDSGCLQLENTTHFRVLVRHRKGRRREADFEPISD